MLPATEYITDFHRQVIAYAGHTIETPLAPFIYATGKGK
jgi:hypothetical protein